jgi:hypothetical protein
LPAIQEASPVRSSDRLAAEIPLESQMSSSKSWLVPLTGVGFFVVGIISFAIMGEPKSAGDPVNEIVSYYKDNDDQIMISAMLTAVAGVLLIFFGAHLREVLRGSSGERDSLALVSMIGLVIVTVGFAIDATISFALAEAADDIEPSGVQALQALWDNDFIPMMLGIVTFLWATGIAILRGAPLPKWIGWVMILLGIIGVTPIGFAAAIGSALLVVILSILLAIRGKSATRPVASPPPTSTF